MQMQMQMQRHLLQKPFHQYQKQSQLGGPIDLKSTAPSELVDGTLFWLRWCGGGGGGRMWLWSRLGVRIGVRAPQRIAINTALCYRWTLMVPLADGRCRL